MAVATRNYGQHTLETNNLDRVAEDFANMIDYRDKTVHPLSSYLSRAGGSEQKDTEEFTLFTGTYIPRTGTLTGTDTIATTGATADVRVASLNGIVAGTLLHFPSSTGSAAGKLVRVTAVDTANTEINVRNLSSGAVSAGADFVIVGNGSTEDETAGPDAFDMEPSSVVGYMSILKRRVTLTLTEKGSKVRGAADRLQEKLERAKADFLLDRAHSAWFSRATKDATNKIRTSMGIHEQIIGSSSATKTNGGNAVLSDTMIANTVSGAMKYASSFNFACFHGKLGTAGLWKLAAGKLQTRYGDTSYGFKAMTVSVSSFTLDFVYERVFDIIGAPYDEMIFGLDLPKVKGVHLEGGQPRLVRNVQTDDSGEVESHIFRAQCGVSIATPERHWVIYDLAAPS